MPRSSPRGGLQSLALSLTPPAAPKGSYLRAICLGSAKKLVHELIPLCLGSEPATRQAHRENRAGILSRSHRDRSVVRGDYFIRDKKSQAEPAPSRIGLLALNQRIEHRHLQFFRYWRTLVLHR